MTIQIVDNFLPVEQFKPIQSLLLGPEIAWFYNPYVVHENENGTDSFQFTHTFFRPNIGPTSGHYDILQSCIEKLNVQVLIRCKANLNPVTSEPITRTFHTDYDIVGKTAIYYINTNNGFTIFEDGTKIESVENRMLIFNTHYKHTGITTTDTKARVLINFNYIPH